MASASVSPEAATGGGAVIPAILVILLYVGEQLGAPMILSQSVSWFQLSLAIVPLPLMVLLN